MPDVRRVVDGEADGENEKRRRNGVKADPEENHRPENVRVDDDDKERGQRRSDERPEEEERDNEKARESGDDRLHSHFRHQRVLLENGR